MTSVNEQVFSDYEHILIDGISDDNTWKKIKTYSSSKSIILSEKDTGIYNAMNKGIKKAKGKYIIFLNADDYFFNKMSLHNIHSNLHNKSNSKLVFAGSTIMQTRNKKYYEWRPANPAKSSIFYRQNPHPSFVVSTKNKDEIYFDENYKICADLEQQLNLLYLKNYKFIYHDTPITVMSFGGASTISRLGFINSFQESASIYSKLFSRFSLFFATQRIFRKIFQRNFFLIKKFNSIDDIRY
jgi:glycosyltransferase involved in cell wall biosynthesis